jgi:hypothetical protein
MAGAALAHCPDDFGRLMAAEDRAFLDYERAVSRFTAGAATEKEIDAAFRRYMRASDALEDAWDRSNRPKPQ